MHETPTPPEAIALVAGGPDRTSELGLALTRILRDPIAGLRASMQAVVSEARRNNPDSLSGNLDGILDQVARLARDVESLAQFATPLPLRPLRCTLKEVLHAATRNLPADQLDRLKIAQPAQPFALVVDGPQLASSLHHLLESALETEADWLLLQVRRDNARTHFALVEGAAAPSFEPLDEEGSQREAHLGLGLRLAHRDICRMGGEFHVEHTERGFTRIVLSVPDGPDARRSSER